MRRLHRNQIKYGFSTGVFVFGSLWLVALVVLGDNTPAGVEQWRASLWLVLGMHFIDISAMHFESFTIGSLNAVDIFEDVPVQQLRFLPPAFVAIGSYYAANSISYTNRFRYNLENAGTVLLGYLSALAGAFYISNINPTAEFVVTLSLLVPVALFLGSTLLSKSTGGLTFFGIVGLRSVLILGLLVIFIGMFLLDHFGMALLQLGVGIGFGGAIVYFRRDNRSSLTQFVATHWTAILLFLLLGGGLFVALGGAEKVDEAFGGVDVGSGLDIGTGGELSIAETEELIADGTNAARTEHGESNLTMVPALSDVARAHSQDMMERGYFSHDSPEGNVPFDRVQEGGDSCQTVGENIAQTWWEQRIQSDARNHRIESNQELAEALVEQWMNSPGHRENILSTGYSRIGVGVAVSDEGEVYATQVFCN